jgi:hypothetical protein
MALHVAIHVGCRLHHLQIKVDFCALVVPITIRLVIVPSQILA